MSFGDYLGFYRFPHDTFASTYRKQFDLIIRFEDLQGGFSRFIELIGAEEIRPFPTEKRH